MSKSEKTSKSAKENISDKERVDSGQILVRVVVEVLGAPKEHVEESIQLVVSRVHKIENVDVLSENTYEAEKKENGLFSTFSELEIWFRSVDQLIQFLFDFTPSSVEVIQPDSVVWRKNIFSGLCNDFLLKMHDSGMKLSDTTAKLMLVKNNADALVRNFVNFLLDVPRSAEEMSKLMGIPVDNVKAILETFIKAGVASEIDGVFSKISKAN